MLMFFFLFCHQTIRVTVVLEFETISSCWTWYCNVFFLYCHQTIRVTLLLEFETISSCWTLYGTDIGFLLLSPNYQSSRVIRI